MAKFDFFGKRSGFRNLRDLLLFVIGAAGSVYEIFFAGRNPNVSVLVACLSAAAAPYVLSKDERG